MIRVLVFLCCVLSAQAWGVVRYATPTGGATSGVCPVGTPCTLDRCRSLSNVAGDICYLNPGRYSEGINTSGTGTAVAPILFECLGEVGDCILDGPAQGFTDRVIAMDTSYVTINKMKIIVLPIVAASTYGARMEHTGTGNKITNFIATAETSSVVSVGLLQWAIQARGLDFEVSDGLIYNVQTGININTDSSAPTGIAERNVIFDLDQGAEENADCLNAGSTVRDANYAVIVRDNDCSGWPDDGMDFIGISRVIVEDNWIHNPGASTTSSSGLKMGGNPGGLGPTVGSIFRRNFVDVRGDSTHNDYCAVAPGLTNGVIESNIFVTDDDVGCVELSAWTLSPYGGGTGNTVRNNVIMGGTIGLYVRAASTGTLAYNNILIGRNSDVNVETGADVTGSTNDLAGTGTKAGVGTYTSTGDVFVDPGFVGGASPTTADGFYLEDTSLLVGAGTAFSPPVLGYGNRFLGNPPAIGARGARTVRAPVTNLRAAP